jgi:hypothetical protein
MIARNHRANEYPFIQYTASQAFAEFIKTNDSR